VNAEPAVPRTVAEVPNCDGEAITPGSEGESLATQESAVLTVVSPLEVAKVALWWLPVELVVRLYPS
jgi:hypothetical protein